MRISRMHNPQTTVMYTVLAFIIIGSVSCSKSDKDINKQNYLLFASLMNASYVKTIADVGGQPDGVTVTETGTAYITDIENGDIKQITPEGAVTTIVSGSMSHPDGITVTNENGNDVLYVTETGTGDLGPTLDNPFAAGNDGVVVRIEVTPAGETTVTTVVDSAVLNSPTGIAVDNAGNLYVADQTNGQVYLIPMVDGIAQAPEALTTTGEVVEPHGLALVTNEDNSVTLYTTDQYKDNIVQIDIPADGNTANTTVTDLTPSEASVPEEEKTIKNPHGIAVDHHGALFVCDEEGNRVQVITPSGEVNNIAGSGNPGDSSGSAANTEFNSPRGLASDTNGKLYVCDYKNGKVKVVKP